MNEWSPFELAAVAETHRNLSTLLQQPELLLKEEDESSSLRHFYITGELSEFAFPGSYRLELLLLQNDQSQGAVVNSISVLGRADPERCAACRDRQAAGSHVRGYMHLDPRLILYLIGQLPPDRRATITELEHLVVLIQESFGMRLVKPDGTALAAAGPLAAPNNSSLEEIQAPKLSLHSQVIKFQSAEGATPAVPPIKFEQRVTHGTFGDSGGWKVL